MSTTQGHPEASGFAEFDHTAQQISEEVAGKNPEPPSLPQARRHPLTDQASAYAHDAWRQVSRAGTSATATIHQRPLTSLLIAGAVGWVLGLLAGRRG